jgi:hypothetical protein
MSQPSNASVKARSDLDESMFRPSESAADWESQGWTNDELLPEVAERMETIISVRFDSTVSAEVRNAARLTGRSMSQFIRDSSRHCAQQVNSSNRAQPSAKVLGYSVSQIKGESGTPSISESQALITQSSGKEVQCATVK